MRTWMAAPLALLLAACTAGETPAPTTPTTPTAPAAASAPTQPAGPTGTLPGDRLPGLRTTVIRAGGGTESFDLAERKGTTVLVVMSTQCPYCAEAVSSLRRIEDTFAGRGV